RQRLKSATSFEQLFEGRSAAEDDVAVRCAIPRLIDRRIFEVILAEGLTLQQGAFERFVDLYLESAFYSSADKPSYDATPLFYRMREPARSEHFRRWEKYQRGE